MNPKHITSWREPLLGQLRWFMRLRWMAGAAALFMGLADWQLLHWYRDDAAATVVGLGILVYNTLLWWALRGATAANIGRWLLLGMSWVQFLLDITVLTLLALWTGGSRSPLLGLFVLHMVFAGLLLPRAMAYGGAAATIIILVAALKLDGLWPKNREQQAGLVGWSGAVLGTVLVSAHIARSLRRQWRRVARQNRRILSMSRQLRRQQQAIVQAEKMAALGQMAAGVAHEISNPLASMDSLLQLMLRKPERLKSESLTTLREQIERIGRIVRELTTFARPADAQWQTVPLNDVVRESLQMLAFDSRLKAVALEEDLSPQAGEVPMLPQALQQVLINLIRNALDAMESVASPRLRIRTAREDDWCVIEVADNGHGIEPRNLRKLFEPFFTTKPVGRGTGLGLSISYALIQKHGGMIAARSKPGEGAAFTVKLPVPRQNKVIATAH